MYASSSMQVVPEMDIHHVASSHLIESLQMVQQKLNPWFMGRVLPREYGEMHVSGLRQLRAPIAIGKPICSHGSDAVGYQRMCTRVEPLQRMLDDLMEVGTPS